MLDPGIVEKLIASALILFTGGAAGALLFSGQYDLCRRVSHSFALAGSAVLLAASVSGLLGGTFERTIPQILPLAGGLSLGLDRLSAFFLLIIAAGVIPSTLYAFGYARGFKDKLPAMGLSLNVFVAALALVTLSRNVLTFLLFWEVMSLSSYFLVMTDSESADTRSAGWIYLVMTHAGLACLLIGFLTMSSATGTYSMSAWASAQGPDLRLKNAAFVMLAVGFLSKAGAIPFHIWLPRAHPAAPSHISAMMSGVMIKLGIYGLIRIGFDWLGRGPAWWGAVVLVVGSVSALLGVLYALIDSDLKRLLAYSSVENVGIILLGVGAALLFRSYHLDGLAALALIAALYHSLNHALFKSLLFLGAGSVVHAIGTRNMEEMGGLMRRMPQTAALFLVGSLSISAMPVSNGFISEWLTFQSLLLSFQVPARFFNLLFALSIAALALTAGLSAACFVRAFGISFLALPRGSAVDAAHEGHWTMRVAMMLFAAACVVLGVLPALVLRPLSGVAREMAGQPPDLSFNWSAIAASDVFAAIAPPWAALMMALLILVVWLGLRLAGVNRRIRYYETWGCGRALQTAAFEYTAAAFANPFKRVFSFLYRPVEHTEVESHPESRFFVKTITYRHESRSIIEDSLYKPVGSLIRQLAAKARTVQSGNVHSYLLYILLALITLLLFFQVVMMFTEVSVTLLQWLVAILGAPLLIGVIRRMKARLQGRQGPDVIQPYRNLRKLMFKEVVISENTSWIFRATPYVSIGTMLMAAFIVPVLTTVGATHVLGNIILLMYLFLLGVFFMALAALDAGSSFGGMGSSREMAIAALAEPTVMIAIFAIALRAGSTGLSEMIERSLSDPLLLLNPGHLLAFFSLFIVVLAENGRLPVDNPSTHLELTMIHEAMILEYSGRYLALIEWASSIKLFLFLTLLANIFWPWGIAVDLHPVSLAVSVLALVVKIGALSAILAIIETGMAKLRLFLVPELLSGSFMLALLAVISFFFLR